MKIDRDELINTINALTESNGGTDGQGRIYIDAAGHSYGYNPARADAWQLTELALWTEGGAFEVADLKNCAEWIAEEIISELDCEEEDFVFQGD